MKKGSRRGGFGIMPPWLWPGLIFVVLTLFLGWTLGKTDAFHNCVESEKVRSVYRSLGDGGHTYIDVPNRVALMTTCGLRSGSDALVVMLNALLVLFTFTLWRSSENVLRLTERAFVSLERPYLRVFGVKEIEIDPEVPGGLEGRVTIRVANYGRVPARVREVRIGFTKGRASEPDVVVIRNSLVVEPDIAPMQEREIGWEFPVEWKRRSEPTRGIIIPLGEEEVFLSVLITYDGVASWDHRASGCWIFDRANECFRPYGEDPFGGNN